MDRRAAKEKEPESLRLTSETNFGKWIESTRWKEMKGKADRKWAVEKIDHIIYDHLMSGAVPWISNLFSSVCIDTFHPPSTTLSWRKYMLNYTWKTFIHFIHFHPLWTWQGGQGLPVPCSSFNPLLLLQSLGMVHQLLLHLILAGACVTTTVPSRTNWGLLALSS